MNKIDMREWVSAVEGLLDHKLTKWKKETHIENGEAVQMRWQYEQTHIELDVFWEDAKEMVILKYSSPRISHEYRWQGLDDKTISHILDRVGNLAQVTMHPPIDAMGYKKDVE